MNTNYYSNAHSSNAKNQNYQTREDARVLARRMSHGKVRKEEIGAISNGSTVFLGELTSCLKNIIESDRQGYAQHAKTMADELDVMLEILRDGNVTSEERMEIMRIISDINGIMERSERDRKIEHGAIALGVLAVIGVFVGKMGGKGGGLPGGKNGGRFGKC